MDMVGGIPTLKHMKVSWDYSQHMETETRSNVPNHQPDMVLHDGLDWDCIASIREKKMGQAMPKRTGPHLPYFCSLSLVRSDPLFWIACLFR